MKRGLNKHITLTKHGIVWLLLFIFSNLLLAEGLHTHKPFLYHQVSVSTSPDDAVVKQPQSFCKFCDYLAHQHHILVPVIHHLSVAQVKLMYANKVVFVPFAYTVHDLLLYSGNSPPIA